MSTQNVLLTGPYGEAGEAMRTYFTGSDEYEFTLLDREDNPEYETHVTDTSGYEAIRPAFDDQDTVIHLAAQSDAGEDLEEVIQPNIVGTVHVLKAKDAASRR